MRPRTLEQDRTIRERHGTRNTNRTRVLACVVGTNLARQRLDTSLVPACSILKARPTRIGTPQRKTPREAATYWGQCHGWAQRRGVVNNHTAALTPCAKQHKYTQTLNGKPACATPEQSHAKCKTLAAQTHGRHVISNMDRYGQTRLNGRRPRAQWPRLNQRQRCDAHLPTTDCHAPRKYATHAHNYALRHGKVAWANKRCNALAAYWHA